MVQQHNTYPYHKQCLSLPEGQKTKASTSLVFSPKANYGNPRAFGEIQYQTSLNWISDQISTSTKGTIRSIGNQRETKDEIESKIKVRHRSMLK